MNALSKPLFPFLFVGISLALSTSVSAQSITDSAWVPVEIAGQAVEAGEDVLIQFDASGSAFGNAGCNNFNGSFVTNGDAILVGPLAATMMMCEESVSMMEMQIFRALEAARTYSVDSAKLALSDADGAPVMMLVARARE